MSTCRSCDAEIVWASSITKKRIPLDPEPVVGGNIELDTGSMRMTVVGVKDDGIPRHVAHFVTCPHANAHRQKRP